LTDCFTHSLTAMMVSAGHRQGHLACRSTAATISKRFLWDI